MRLSVLELGVSWANWLSYSYLASHGRASEEMQMKGNKILQEVLGLQNLSCGAVNMSLGYWFAFKEPHTCPWFQTSPLPYSSVSLLSVGKALLCWCFLFLRMVAEKCVVVQLWPSFSTSLKWNLRQPSTSHHVCDSSPAQIKFSKVSYVFCF